MGEEDRASRRRDEDLIRSLDARLGKSRPGDDPQGPGRYLGKIIDGGNMPTKSPAFYLTRPISIAQDTPEAEAAEPTLAEGIGGDVPVLILGGVPKVDDMVPARLIEGGFWAARMGGYGYDECGECHPPEVDLRLRFTYASRPYMGTGSLVPRDVDITLKFKGGTYARIINHNFIYINPSTGLTPDLVVGATAPTTYWSSLTQKPYPASSVPESWPNRFNGIPFPFTNPYWVPRLPPFHLFSLICHKGALWLVHRVEVTYPGPVGLPALNPTSWETMRRAVVESCDPLALSFPAEADAYAYQNRIASGTYPTNHDENRYYAEQYNPFPPNFGEARAPRLWTFVPWAEHSFQVTI